MSTEPQRDTRSARVDVNLWSQFAFHCKSIGRRISDVLEEVIRDYMKKAGPSDSKGFVFNDIFNQYRKLYSDLKKMRKAMDKEFGRNTFNIIRDHYKELGGKDDLSNFDEIRPKFFSNPLNIENRDEALLSFWNYASFYKKYLVIKNQLIELSKSSNLPITVEQSNSEDVKNDGGTSI